MNIQQVVKLTNVTKKIFNKHNSKSQTILENINYSASSSEMSVVMGPSGSGKSTLLNIIGSLDNPSSGELYINNRLINDLNEVEKTKLRANTIGIVFQSFNLLPNLSVIENITLPLLLNKKISKSSRNKKALELLESIGLVNQAYCMPNTLSGGETQRVAIARAIISRPSILLADEPTGNVDSENETIIIDLFKQLKRSGVCLIIVTHNPIYKQHADNVYNLCNGELIKESIR